MSKTIEELKEKQALELIKLEREIAIRDSLPLKITSSICIHSDYSSVTCKAESFAHAVKLVEDFKPFVVKAEHWKSACLSVAPSEINSYSKDERAVMDGSSYVELIIESFGSRGEYIQMSLKFWARIGEEWLKVEVQFPTECKWIPNRHTTYNRQGVLTNCTISRLGLGEDQARAWWSEKPSYHFSYYWADVYNWESWAKSKAA